jgi:hypothetical protein
MNMMGAPWRVCPAGWRNVWKPGRAISALFIIIAAAVVFAQSAAQAQPRDLPLYYYQKALEARANYVRSLKTNRPDVIRAYYDYALAAHDDYVRAYRAFYAQQPQIVQASAHPPQVAMAPKPTPAKTRPVRHKEAEEMRREVAQTDKTTLHTAFGFRYQTNTSGRPTIIDRVDSIIFNLDATLLDERSLSSDFRWRTLFNADADFYVSNGDHNFQTLMLQTGPVFPVAKGWQIAFAPFAEVNINDNKYFSYRAGVGTALENLGDSWLNNLQVKFARETFSDEFPGYDANQPEVSATFAAYSLFDKGDILYLTPSAIYNDAETDALHYWQPGFLIQYDAAIMEKLRIAFDFEWFSRLYDGGGINVAGNRRDTNFRIGPTLTYRGFFVDDVALVARYNVINNLSNDREQDYASHVSSINMKWQF